VQGISHLDLGNATAYRARNPIPQSQADGQTTECRGEDAPINPRKMRRCDRTLDQEGLGKANRPMERNRNESAESTAKDSEGQKPLPFRGNESDEEQVEPFADGLKIGRRWQNNFSPANGLVLAVWSFQYRRVQLERRTARGEIELFRPSGRILI